MDRAGRTKNEVELQRLAKCCNWNDPESSQDKSDGNREQARSNERSRWKLIEGRKLTAQRYKKYNLHTTKLPESHHTFMAES